MDEIQMMQRFDSDSDWFHSNVDFFRNSNLTGKFVAIKNKKIIESGKDIDAVINLVEKNGEDSSMLVVEFVYPAGSVILL